MSKVSTAVTARCSSHLPIPMRTVKSWGLPEIMMVIARSAAITPRRKPPFLACRTTPCSLGVEVWVVKPSFFRYSSMWD